MSAYVPWDADDDEIAELTVVRGDIPPELRPVLRSWLQRQVTGPYDRVPVPTVHVVQSALRVGPLTNDDDISPKRFVAEFERQGDKMFLRLLDLFLANTEPEWQNGRPVAPGVEALRTHLVLTGSALEIVQRDSEFRLSRRVPEGTEQLAQVAIDSARGHAGQHLAKAWRAAFDFEPDPSAAMTDAIRAVEAAAGAVVTPKDGMARLGKIVQALRDQSGWGLDFQTRDDGHPDHKHVLIGMLESLAFAQRDRHAGEPPTAAQAQAHVQLASTLVFWFSNGAVARSTE